MKRLVHLFRNIFDRLRFEWYCLTTPRATDSEVCKRLRAVANKAVSDGDIELARKLWKMALRIEQRGAQS